MARVDTIVVGGGLSAVDPLAIGGLVEIAAVGPPPTAQLCSVAGVSPTTFPRSTHVVVGPNTVISGAGRYTTSTTPGVLLVGASVAVQAEIGTASSVLAVGNSVIARSTAGQVIATTVIGQGANAITVGGISGATVIGFAASYTGGDRGVVIGDSSLGSAARVTVVGSQSSGQANDCTIVGAASTVNQINCVAIGSGATITAANATSVGNGTGVSQSGGVAIGQNANVSHTDSICIGRGAQSYAANVCVIGGSGGVTEVLVGKNNTNAAPSSVIFRLTNAVGTDIASGNYIIQAGLGTGAGLPGDIQLTVGVSGASSATAQNPRQGVVVRHSSTAADTYLMVWDVNGAALKRVSVGANDSGGVGFKVLRIAN